jgi:hypothetical protein
MSAALLFLPFIFGIVVLITIFYLRWRVERADPDDGLPVSEVDLNREKPSSLVVDISFDILEPLLEKIEYAIDSGFSESQRSTLLLRVSSLLPGSVTSAIFPVRYDAESTDILMHFGRVDLNLLRCRFQSNAALISRIKGFLRDISSSTT